MKLIQKGRHPMLATTARALYRARWIVLLLGLAMALGAGLFGSGLFPLLKAGGFEDPNSQSAQAEKLLDTQLGGSTTDIVILMRSDGLSPTDPTFASAATGLLDMLKARREVGSVISYYSTGSPRFLSRDGHETFALVQLATTDVTMKTAQYKILHPLITSHSSALAVSV